MRWVLLPYRLVVTLIMTILMFAILTIVAVAGFTVPASLIMLATFLCQGQVSLDLVLTALVLGPLAVLTLMWLPRQIPKVADIGMRLCFFPA